MFSKDTYLLRRAELKRLVGEGIIVFFGVVALAVVIMVMVSIFK